MIGACPSDGLKHLQEWALLYQEHSGSQCASCRNLKRRSSEHSPAVAGDGTLPALGAAGVAAGGAGAGVPAGARGEFHSLAQEHARKGLRPLPKP